ncbi:MAG: S-layer homology domain-containing protein [Patescibacteria group bacterium]
MARKVLISVFLLMLALAPVRALTDPSPDPFDDLAEGEKVFNAKVVEADEEVLTVQDDAGATFSGRMEAIFKYRDGAGPAAPNEFFAGDSVRVLVNGDGVVEAAQDANLLLCDQNFYGWVREPTKTDFTLETVAGAKYQVFFGATTQFRDENSKILFGYSPRADDVIRIHGVVNTNAKKIFTETFGAYVSLLDEAAIAPLLAEVEAQKEAARAKLDAELAQQKFGDVPTANKFFYAVNFLAHEKIAAGYADGGFRPSGQINRAEFTKILVQTKFADELDAFELPTESCFPDVPPNAWFAKFVCFAKAQGILGGYPDGQFKPSNPVNLAEAVTILVKTFGLAVESNSKTWYAPFVERASKLAILPTDFAQPSQNLTRGQMAELVMRALKYSRGDLTAYLEKTQNAQSN